MLLLNHCAGPTRALIRANKTVARAEISWENLEVVELVTLCIGFGQDLAMALDGIA